MRGRQSSWRLDRPTRRNSPVSSLRLVAANFVDVGEQNLKNIARPVRVYRLDLAPKTPSASEAPRLMAAPPDKPSIAVLAFNNMSGDPEQEYFSDGISEDI